MLTKGRGVAVALFAVPFIDELSSGIAPASVPDVARDLHVGPGFAAGGVLIAFFALGLFVDAPLLAWSERFRVRWFSAASLAVMAVSMLAAAVAPGPWTLFAALAVYGPAVGCALAASEGVLVEARPDERERTMARIGLAAALGDLGVPALLAALAAVGMSWRAGFVAAAIVAALLAVVHASSRTLDRRPVLEDDEDGPSPTVREALRTALRNRPLLAWSVAAALTSLLDETLVAFAAVHLDAIGASSLVRSIAIGGWTVGGLAGLAVLERKADSLDPRATLLGSSAITAIGLAILTLTRSPIVAAAALVAIGASSASLHPLAKARAYASLPGRPALVNAMAAALVPVDIVAPLALGVIAARAGSASAVGAILLAPLGIALMAGAARGAPEEEDQRGEG